MYKSWKTNDILKYSKTSENEHLPGFHLGTRKFKDALIGIKGVSRYRLDKERMLTNYS